MVVTSRSRKERFSMILEPLQATMQLSLLSFMPVGTKLTIHDNILYMQAPRWHQPFMRFYNNDNKEDLYFLFHVLIRFTKFYNSMKESEDSNLRDFYYALIEYSKRGIEKLIQTYQSSNDYALINILQLYRTIMENPEEFRHVGEDGADIRTPSKGTGVSGISGAQVETLSEKEVSSTRVKSKERERRRESGRMSMASLSVDDELMSDIDKIFVTIQKVYTKHDYYIMYNTLCLLRETENMEDTACLVRGVSATMELRYGQIRRWIHDNIVY
tara:strand:+ start:1284 stop:2099 length:816 start_codon:yes stop_codon:yes gene_type:complete